MLKSAFPLYVYVMQKHEEVFKAEMKHEHESMSSCYTMSNIMHAFLRSLTAVQSSAARLKPTGLMSVTLTAEQTTTVSTWV